jgi:hypothetical protein
VAVFVWRMSELNDSRDTYVTETDRSRVQHDYDRYERDNRAAWAAGIVAGVVYVAIQTELALLRKPGTQAGLSLSAIPLLPLPTVGFAVRW